MPLTPQLESESMGTIVSQVRRIHLGQGVLGTAGIAGAESADLAVGPGLRRDPLDDLVRPSSGSLASPCQVPSLAYRPRVSLATTT